MLVKTYAEKLQLSIWHSSLIIIIVIILQ